MSIFYKKNDLKNLSESGRIVSSRDLPIEWGFVEDYSDNLGNPQRDFIGNWQEHVFFGSAVARTNSAAENILQTYPYDGSIDELNDWIDDLNGWQNWLWENWIQYTGSVKFEYVNVTSNPYLYPPDAVATAQVMDFNALRDDRTHSNIKISSQLNPNDKPLVLQFYIKVEDNGDDVGVCSHYNENGDGWSIYIKHSSDNPILCATLTISDSFGNPRSTTLEKEIIYDEWLNVLIGWDTPANGRAPILYIDGVKTTPDFVNKNILNTLLTWDNSINDILYIGFTPNINLGNEVLNIESFGGYYLDEFRMYHKIPNSETIKKSITKNIWAQDGLVLQLRFNDSPDTKLKYNSFLVPALLDSSGNGLHAGLTIDMDGNLSPQIKLLQEAPTRLVEPPQLHPCIYPLDSRLRSFLEQMRDDGREYDDSNPNIIVKLVPPHYFSNPSLEPREQISSIDDSRESAAILSALLYTWAEFWDDLKLRADAFTTALSVDSIGQGAPAPFLKLAAKELGVNLPNVFEDMLPDKWDEGYQKVQEVVWRRLLIAMPRILMKKGTIEGIKSLFASIGNNNILSSIRFREYGNLATKIHEQTTVVQQNIRLVDTEGKIVVALSFDELETGIADPDDPLSPCALLTVAGEPIATIDSSGNIIVIDC